MEPTINQPAPSEKKSFGPLVGIIVIIIALALGALYVWGGKLSSTDEAPATDTTASTTTSADTGTSTITTTTVTSTTTVTE